MKKKVPALALAALLAPAAAFAQSTTPTTFSGLADEIVGILGSATTDLIVLAIVIYFWGVSSSMFKGEKGRENLREQLIWGVVVIFFAVSIWGVVTLLQNSLFGSNLGVSSGNGTVQCDSLGNCVLGAGQ